ncbi:tripartite tricarboxylate transporter TctB family protein [Ancylobacter sp. A5.8]|uniref:tripartite tricarboxylate transporter TctB family protein n=1 Tax=Ancylobacter gelatini TaxID=2919920 RepID=UPI001F4E69F6|nr:tripartite tricarboxylate transporter TctB family protein [Ancylobacter gelatini]MCJ8145195.1 tripartite tricarboxylate transporter TctB family protein [Ancylobacter gelatini]
MKIGGGLLGLLIVALGLAVIWNVRGFPSMPGHSFGPGLFPTMIAGGLLVCGGLLLVRVLRAAPAGAFSVDAGAWRDNPHGAVSGAMMVAAILAFIFLGDEIGFQIIGFVTLCAFYLWLGRGPVKALTIAALVIVSLDLLFRIVLRVPVPSGPLTGLW